MNTKQTEEKVTALYERLSQDDELTEDNKCIINQKNISKITQGKTNIPIVDIILMMVRAAAILNAMHGNGC